MARQTVYRATDARSNQIVTIRFLGERASQDDAIRGRLLRDAEALARFSHPFVASLLELARMKSRVASMSSTSVAGTTLLDVLEQRHLSALRAVRLGMQLGEVVADIHGAGLAHRDLGPGTVMIAPDGRAHVLFLGAGSGAIGPRPYLAPEGWRGDACDELADVYSLGVLLAQMLNGRSLPIGAAPSAIVRRIDPALPDDLRRVIVRALAADPAERCGSAAAFAAELSGVAAMMDLRKR